MIDELKGMKSLFGLTDTWLNEINNAPNHKIIYPDGSESIIDNSAITDSRTRVNYWQSYGSIHPYPRVTLRAEGWEYENRGVASCRSRIMIYGLVELIRKRPGPRTDADTSEIFSSLSKTEIESFGNQYLEVCETITSLATSISERSDQAIEVPDSYDLPLAKVKFNIFDPPQPWQSQENSLVSESDENLTIWFTNMHMVATVG